MALSDHELLEQAPAHEHEDEFSLPDWLSWVLLPLSSIFAWAPALFPGYWASFMGLLPAMGLVDPASAALLGYHASPLFASAANLFGSLGFGALDAIRVLYVLSVLASGWTMYAFSSAFYLRFMEDKPQLVRLAALAATLLYIYLPYRFAAAFELGEPSVGLALAGLPLVFWAADRIGNDGLDIAALAVLITGISWLNASEPAWGIPVLGGAAGLMLLGKRRGLPQVTITLGVTVAFGYSMLTTVRNTSIPIALPESVLPAFVSLPQLLLPIWGQAPLGPGPAGGGDGLQMTYQLGLLQVLFALLAMLIWLPEEPQPTGDADQSEAQAGAVAEPDSGQTHVDRRLAVVVAAGWIYGLLLIALMLDWSPAHVLWHLIGSGPAWTLLGVAGCVLSLLGGIPLVLLAELRASFSFAWTGLAVVTLLAVILTAPLQTARFIEASNLNVAQYQHYRFGDTVLLAGSRIGSTVRPGADIQIDLWWQPLGAAPKQYTTFIHLVPALGRPPLAQQDKLPLLNAQNPAETYKMTDWKRGDLLKDSYILKLPADLKPGEYIIAIGMYASGNPGERITIYNGDQPAGDMVALGKVHVE